MLVKIHKVPPDGSCFYHAVSFLFLCKTSGNKTLPISVPFLRQLVASQIRKIISKPSHPLHSMASFYINDLNMTVNSYITDTLNSLWAGPLEALILAKALKIRIQIYPKQTLRRTGVKHIFSVSYSDAIVDAGDKRCPPLKLVLHGYNISKNLSGCHFDALF